MKHAPALAKRANLLILAAILAAASIVPALLMKKVHAYGQPAERSINISTSQVSATGVVYTVSFKPTVTATIQGIVVDFCTSPLPGTVCTAPTGLNVDTVTLGGALTGFSIDATATIANKAVLTGAGTSLPGGTAVSFTLTGATNPSTNGSFYARIATYTSSGDATGYDSSTENATNPGPATDAGGVAMSTATQLTVNARVQEVLVFCVGTDDAGSASDCTDISGNTVDLGVVQAGIVSMSPVATTSGGNNRSGLAMVRTNAVNGVAIDYFPSAVTGDTGSGNMGSLRVAGADCSASDGLPATGLKTDQCFNNAAATITAFAPGDEGFGMQVRSTVDTSNGTTTNLIVDAAYGGNGTPAAGFAWSPSSTARIASSTGSTVKVVDDELLTLNFGAQAAVTTPTGQYGVTTTYIATASY